MNNHITDFTFFKQNSFGDKELYRELLAIFVKTTPEMVAQMQEALREENYEQLGKVAHKLKSNVQSVGLENVYVLLDEIENHNANKLNESGLRHSMAVINQKCQTAVDEVVREMESIVKE